MQKRLQRKVVLFFIFVVTFLYYSFSISSFGAYFQDLLTDTFFHVRQLQGKKITPSEDVVILAVDEKTYNQQKKRFLVDNLSRPFYTEFFKKLTAYNPKAVLLDFAFGEKISPSEDIPLQNSIRNLPVIMPCGFTEIVQKKIDGEERYLNGVNSDPFFASAAKSCGHVFLGTDLSKNVIIRYAFTRNYSPLTFTEAAVRFADPSFQLFDHRKRTYINYYGGLGTIPYVSISDIMADSLTPKQKEFLKNKYFLVSIVNDFYTEDVHRTPLGLVPGVEIHANILSNILQKEWITSYSGILVHFIHAVVLFLLGCCIVYFKPKKALIFVVAVTVIWFVFGYIFFLNNKIYTDYLFIICLFLIFIINNLLSYLKSEFNNRCTLNAIARFAGKEVAAQLAKDPENIAVAGRPENIIALSTDLAGFTKMSENLGAETVIKILNEYFNLLSHETFMKKGTVLGYGGDAMYAIWGGFQKVATPADLCLKCALDIQLKIKELAKNAPTMPPLPTRIGIDSGEAIIGTLGGEALLTYTCIGTPMNIASRLQKINEYLGTWIIATERVKNQISLSSFYYLNVGRFFIRGINEPIVLYAFFENDFDREIRKIWEEALKLFQGRDFKNAIIKFELITESRLEKIKEFYIALCHEFLSTPPKEGWVGEVEIDG